MKIFDTSSIICILGEINHPKILDVCKNNGYSIAIPLPVFEELKKERKTFEKVTKHNHFKIISDFDQSEYEEMLRRYPNLHKGEISVICCGLNRMRRGDRHYCIIDEKAARSFIKNNGNYDGLNLTGTVGLIYWEKNNSYLSKQECGDIHASFKESGFWIKDSIIKGLVE